MEMTWAPTLVKMLLCFLMVFVDMQGSEGCLEKERLGLLEIKHFFNSHDSDEFKRHEALPSWVDDREANCCDWERLHCNQTTGRVTHLILDALLPTYNSVNVVMNMNFSLLHPFEQLLYLDLSDNNFNGSVEIEGLCGMKNLLELDISKNTIVNLPECMGNLTSLRVLDLSSTSMTGSLPSFIISLKSLEYISLFDTKIDGILFSLLANHSKLEVFRLSSISDNLHVETENPPWRPTFQLKALQLENCNLNAIPSFILYQHELRLIDLSYNKLQGDFPTWFLNNNSKLETLHLMDNSFNGTLQLPTSTHGLINLGISSNKLGGQLPENIGKIFPNLSYVNLSTNNFEGSFPSSMVEMQRVHTLDLSNNKFSGELATHLFSNWTSLILLSLSYNNFSGQVIPKFAKSAELQYLFLNNNQFCGEINDGFLNKSSLLVMDISSNMVSGRVPTWLANFESLRLLSMSKNLLEGGIPIAICSLHSIVYLDLSENNLSGSLPHCLGNLEELMFLRMQNNSFKGYIPAIFPSRLYSLDLRDNEFFGEIPNAILKSWDALRVLLLGGNQLNGSIPHNTLCDYEKRRIIDLSRNRLTGTIPSSSCLVIDITEDPFHAYLTPDYVKALEVGYEYDMFILENTIPSYNSTLILNYNSGDEYYVINKQLPAEFRTKNNIYSYSGNILKMMSGLDLSCNELSGSIPPEIGNMEDIISLNLSHNRLSGNIPQSLSHLVNLESLDFSYNSLSGAIPQSLVALNSLAIFNVSYNNLSGPTPTKGQFANFDEENYRGNLGLFGPFRKSNLPPPPSKVPNNDEGEENHTNIELVSFYWGFFSSYITVVLGLAIILWFSPCWCRVWFQFVDLCICYSLSCFFRDSFR